MTEERGDDRAAPADLSAAARAIVRDPGDPRMDAHLAALGLGDAAPRSGPRAPVQTAPAAEVAELRRQIGELERDLEAGRARIRTLVIALSAAAIAVVILLALLVVR